MTISGQLRIAQGTGRLPVVILQHGSSGYAANIDTWSRALNEMGISTFALDHAALAVRDQGWRRRARPFATGEASRLAKTARTATAVRLDRQRTKLDRVVAALSAEDRALLSLRIDQRLGWEEIAHVLSAPRGRTDPGTVAKRYERLKARLAARLRDDD